jgi:hypothetical protein
MDAAGDQGKIIPDHYRELSNRRGRKKKEKYSMDKNKQLADFLKQMFDSGAVTVVRGTLDDNGNVAIPLPIEIDRPLPNPDNPNKTIEDKFFFTLVGMAQWAIAHPSTSRYQYISPEEVKANKNLNNAFMTWWYTEHPAVKPEQQKMFDESISKGLRPGGVMEHTADGHHPIGWSWGSEWYLADYYLCLTYATIQLGAKFGKDVQSKFAPISIAKQVQSVNRVKPTVEIVEAMGKLMEEPEPNKTAEYGVVDVEGSSN